MKIAIISRFTGIFLIMGMMGFPVHALVSPRDGSIFTQVHIMFECDDIYGADLYEISIFRLLSPGESAIMERVVTVKTADIASLVTQGLEFGNNYRWQYRAFKKKKLIATSNWNYFTILRSAQVMKDSFRTEISFTRPPGREIIFLDYSAMAIDKRGNPVWFLPVNTDSLSKLVTRDLELTPYGTITHLNVHGAYEKNLQGDILWKAPDDGRVSGGIKEEYHHELKKNNDGSFMVCGSIYNDLADGKRSNAASVKYNTVIHYDTGGKILRSWTETGSMTRDSLFRQAHSSNQGGHLNGFAITPDGNRVFMSFKNLSDVYLYDFVSGRFITSIKRPPFSGPFDFNQQHGPFLTAGNQLLIYNNNIIEKEDTESPAVLNPSIMQFSYNKVSQRWALVWQYEVKARKYPEGIAGKEGYASETNTGNILICTGGANYAAEVTRDKKKIWECYFYHRSRLDTAWKPYSNYRCQGASSLYPLYYTLQYSGQAKGHYVFRLHNAGSEPGSFELNFSGAGGQSVLSRISKKLQPGQSEYFVINIEKRRAEEGLSCRVIPRHLKGNYKDYFYSKLP